MAVLVRLADEAGRVVSKEELLEAVWPETYVTDDAVWRCITELRQALGDRTRDPRFIETLPRRGYRLVAAVDRPAAVPLPDRPRAGRAAAGAAALVLAGVVATLVVTGIRRPAAGPGAGGAPPAAPRQEIIANPAATADELYSLGFDYYVRHDRQDYDRAIELFQRAIAIDPQFALAYAGLADATSKRCAVSGATEACLAPALEAAARAVTLGPALAEAHKAMGLVHQIAGRLTDARRSYRRALELRPGHFAAANNLATIALGTGDLATAVEVLEGLDSTPTEARVVRHGNLSYAYYLLGDLTRARNEAQAALALEPFEVYATWVMGRIELAQGNPVAAQERSRRAVAVHPDAGSCLRAAGEVELLAGDPAAARPLLERSLLVITSGAERAEPLLDLVGALAELGDRQQARRRASELADLAETATAAGSEDYTVAAAAAGAYAVLERRDEAISALRQAIRLGFRDHRWLTLHPAFAGLRDDPRFRDLHDELVALTARHREAVRAAAPSVRAG
jgi:protein kinase/serine/threonine-protein kinase